MTRARLSMIAAPSAGGGSGISRPGTAVNAPSHAAVSLPRLDAKSPGNRSTSTGPVCGFSKVGSDSRGVPSEANQADKCHGGEPPLHAKRACGCPGSNPLRGTEKQRQGQLLSAAAGHAHRGALHLRIALHGEPLADVLCCQRRSANPRGAPIATGTRNRGFSGETRTVLPAEAYVDPGAARPDHHAVAE